MVWVSRHQSSERIVSQQLGLSEDTIRRDLRELAAEGRLQRVHGGALPASAASASLERREEVSTAGKVAIGRAAAHMVRDGQVVLLDGGTTALQIARHLAPELRATVVTHSPTVAAVLGRYPTVEVELIGGRLFKQSMVSTGATAVEAIARIHADIFFMGVTGIHPELGLTTGDDEEAAIKRTMSRQSAETMVLASREKLGAASPFQILSLQEADGLVVEADLPREVLQPYLELGLSVVRG